MTQSGTMRPVMPLPVARRILDGVLLALLALSVASFVSTYSPDTAFSSPVLVLCALAALFLLCEVIQLRFEISRHGYSFTLSEIAMVLALFWVSPIEILVLRLASRLVVHLYQRLPWQKFRVNMVIGVAEVAAATYVFAQFGVNDPQQSRSWLAAYAAIGLAVLTSALAVIAAITLVQGRLSSEDLLRLTLSTVLAGTLNATVGLIVLVLLGVNPWSAILLVIIAAVLIAGYRAYTQFLRQHKSLGDLYEFTRAIGTARQDANLADPLLTRTRQLLNAESATLWIPSHGRHPEVMLTARMDSPGLVDDAIGGDDPIRRRVIATGRAVFVGHKSGEEDPDMRKALRARPAKDVIVVPLRSGNAVIGCLEAANRLGDVSHFGVDDLRLMETLAAHTAVAVENSRLVDRLRHDAYHDALTGLANRRRLVTALEAAIKVQPTPGEVVALLEFDVDSLRDVNETLGHVAGDRLLAEVGRRLATKAPDGALVARIGGDEFAILVRAQGVEVAQAHAVALQYALVEPFELDNFALDVGAAVGIAIHPDHASDAESLMQRADVATYVAKGNPRSIQVYRPAMESRSVHRFGLVSELRRAIEDDALTVHFQPKVSLSTRELVGVECLVRWEHPEYGLVSPDDFIPVAEHTGLVGALTSRVLRIGLEQCRQWKAEGRPIGVSVNLSARSLVDPEFPDELELLLNELGLPPDVLTLEITESGTVGDTDRPLPILHRLSDLGVRLSVDDFGTGYSSLSYLRRLPVDEIKIDKSFVLGMSTDSDDLGIVQAIVDLGRNLDKVVVAEGVESELALRHLEEMRCDVAQGFLFARPLPYERIEAWIAARTELMPTESGDVNRLRVVGE